MAEPNELLFWGVDLSLNHVIDGGLELWSEKGNFPARC